MVWSRAERNIPSMSPEKIKAAILKGCWKFLDRLGKDGITRQNTLFVIGAEENDHLAGANVGRAVAPSDPATCDGVVTPCRYAPICISR